MTHAEWKLKLSDAVDEFCLLRYFPAEPRAQDGIMKLLERMVTFGRVDQLEWLVRTMVDRVGEWQGPKELRGVFCTRFQPADGVEADCLSSRGFTADEMETRAAAPELTQSEARNLLPDSLKDAKKLQ